jgi:hypothetical protein
MPIIQTNQAVNLNPVNLLKSAQGLQQSLSQIAPDQSQTTRIVTYALVATALVGMFVYHYIKTQEEIN